MLERFLEGALKRAAVVFFQNPDDRALFIERRMVRADQARLLPGSGVDLDRFAPTPQASGPPVFLNRTTPPSTAAGSAEAALLGPVSNVWAARSRRA